MNRGIMLALWLASLAGTCLGQTPGVVIDVTDDVRWPLVRGVAPGELKTFWVHGLAIDLAKSVFAPKALLPTSFEGVSVDVLGVLLERGPVHNAAIVGLIPHSDLIGVMVQIPYELDLYDGGTTPAGAGRVNIRKNGLLIASVSTKPYRRLPHILKGSPGALAIAFPEHFRAVSRLDGSWVHELTPVAPGETVKMIAAGLGYNDFPAGQPKPLTGVPAGPNYRLTVATGTIADTFGIAFRFGANVEGGPVGIRETGAPESEGLLEAKLLEGAVGLYQITFRIPDSVPSGTPPCGLPSDLNGQRVRNNLAVSIGYMHSGRGGGPIFDTVGVCVKTTK
ncbi:MAG: hypothetical protein JNL98_35745 [Bryobacterales bacterium]|nr:hypothetical protein [Bryobacterales bacterium]